MDSDDKQLTGNSRRDFLKKAPIGLAGVFALTALGGGLFRRGRGRRRVTRFASDSIFRPRDGDQQEA